MRIDLKGVHKVKRPLSDGTHRQHHYAWRGGPKFWSSESGVAIGSPEYVAAFAACARTPRPAIATVPMMIDAYLDSALFRSRRPRTQADYRKWALRLAREFEEDPATIFQEAGSRGEINRWRERWAHSPKQYDYAATVATVILNWAREAGWVTEHHLDRMKKLYTSDRAEIVWTPQDVATFDATAPEWVRRILGVALETGLRPGDLIRLSWSHVERTPHGRRIVIRTNKRKRAAALPVTPALGAILDATPRDRLTILASHRGRPLSEHRASEAVRQWRDKAGLARNLRLYDARGTAATRLLRAGCSLEEIATFMGWGLRFAANVIEHYAAASGERSDEILLRLATQRAKQTGTEV